MTRYKIVLLSLGLSCCTVGSVSEPGQSLADIQDPDATTVDVIRCTALVANRDSLGATRREVLHLTFLQAGGETVAGSARLLGTDSEQHEGPTYVVEGTDPEFKTDYYRAPIVFHNVSPQGEFVIYKARDSIELVFYGQRISVRENDLAVRDNKTGSLFASPDRPQCVIDLQALGYAAP
jgi:hypothetical protein